MYALFHFDKQISDPMKYSDAVIEAFAAAMMGMKYEVKEAVEGYTIEEVKE